MRSHKSLSWALVGLVCHAHFGYGQHTLVHRNLAYYFAEGLVSSPVLKENVNAITLNRLDSLITIAITKPHG